MIGTSAPPLTTERAMREIYERPGLIPVDIDINAERLVWMDLEDTQLVESYFFRSTQRFLEETAEPFRFSTDLDVLDEDGVVTDSCYPAGFIYHMGRSGSTLLSRALSRVSANLVISEAPPHFFIWPLLQGSWQATILADDRNIRRFRNLTLAMGRRRRDEYSAHFVKFTTYNILFIDFIRSAFPDVPALFLYRHPGEVMIAMVRESPGWSRLKNTDFGAAVAGCTVNEVQKLSMMTFYARCLARFMAAALRASTEGLSLANYGLLRRDALNPFLAALHYQAESQDLLLMQEQFDYYSKDDAGQQRFVPDSAAKRQEITPELEALVKPKLIDSYRKLESARNNLAKYLA
jgi:hypothetical protein